MGRVIIAAMGSGSGKTIVTCGLLQAFKNEGVNLHAYKCGPDYIDPMFHKKVLGIASENLDSFFAKTEKLNELLSYGEDKDLTIIEGVMGIYDGLGGVSSEGSAYDLACKTDTPIILLVDVHGMGRTMISLIKGILLEDVENKIKGVILNRISKGYFDTVKPMIEEETGCTVLGYLGTQKNICIESRHLGLKLPEEIKDLKLQIKQLATVMKETINLSKIMEIANLAKPISLEGKKEKKQKNYCLKTPVRIAVAEDEVFCFLYEENKRVLERFGVVLCSFSPLHDAKLPENISGILLPGGYPELRLEMLEKNDSMRDSIKAAIEKGMPCLAECGGFMYLHKAIVGEDGREYSMVGVIDGICYNTGKLCRFGYVNVEVNQHNIKGHEFHYYDSSSVGSDAVATKPLKGDTWRFGYVDVNRLWGFPHLYYASCEEMIEGYVEAMHKYRKENCVNEEEYEE